MKIIQHTCDFCGFYYEEKAPAGYVLGAGMVVVGGKHMCLDCQQKTNLFLKDELKKIRKNFILAECEEPGGGRGSRTKFYHLSPENYKELGEKLGWN